MMAGWDGRLSDTEIWNIVNYIRALARRTGTSRSRRRLPRTLTRRRRPTLELADYVQMPITGEIGGENTRGQMARVNFLRDEPGGRRFFVNDLNGPLYILDKQTKKLTNYLDFNGVAGGRACSRD